MSRRVTISPRGVVVIPADIRRSWTGNTVLLTEREGDVVVTPIPADSAASVRSAFAHLVSDGPSFDEERAADRKAQE